MPIMDLFPTSSLTTDDINIAEAADTKLIPPVSPDSMIGQTMWKLVFYATGGLLLWSYLKHRRGGD